MSAVDTKSIVASALDTADLLSIHRCPERWREDLAILCGRNNSVTN